MVWLAALDTPYGWSRLRAAASLRQTVAMTNADVAKVFEELADLLEIQGANPFRVRAYRNAARTVESLSESLADIVRNNSSRLTELEGIGDDLAKKIVTIVDSGELPQLNELREEVPQGVRAMLRIAGLGPKKAAALWKELSITSLDQLKQAAEQGQIANLKGFGKKTETSILEGLSQVEQAGTRVYLAEAKPLADAIVADLVKLPGVKQVSAAGSVRRLRETIGDLDVLATASDSAVPMDALAQHPLVEKVLARGETKQRVRLKNGLEMDLRVVPEESYGAAMQYFTGSKEHNIVIRRRAQERGLKVNEYGVFRGEKAIAGRTEEEVYEAVDLPWIPPELRENRGEIERAERGELKNVKLIELDDMRGDLHMHTTATDGAATIREMVDGAKARGRKYIAITDHSKRVSMANGLDAARLRAHWKEIDKVRQQVSGIEVLCGIECDILEDATLDLPDDVLAEADWVIAVLHYGLKQPQSQIMQRLLTAVKCPHVSVIGHPSGRLLGKRPGAAINFDDLFQAAADHGVLMEINAHPSRLDLDDVKAAAAKDRGIPIVISTDAHSVTGLDVMQWGICQARRAGLTAKDVANTRPWGEFKKLLKHR
jgi:DNA polymerase (family 10)